MLGQATPSSPSLLPRPTSRTPRLKARATRSPSVIRSSSSRSRRPLHREPHTAFAQRATMRATGLPSGTTKRDLDPTRLSIGPADFRLIEGEQPLRPACRDIQRGCSSKPRNTPRPISTRRRVSARRYNPKTSFPGRLTPQGSAASPVPKGWRGAWNKRRDKGLVSCKPLLAALSSAKSTLKSILDALPTHPGT